MRAALDTNVLVYAEGVNADARRDTALHLVAQLSRHTAAVPVQVLSELFNVLRRGGWTRDKAAAAVVTWSGVFPSVDTSSAVLLSAVELAARHQITIWDALVLSAAAEGECQLLLTEDMQDGFTWRGVRVVNPFATPRPSVLDELLG